MVPDGSDVKFNVEEVIAETLNRFECKLSVTIMHELMNSRVLVTDWMNSYEMKGPGEVLKAYYEFWLHR